MVLPELRKILVVIVVEMKVFMKNFVLCNISSFTKETLARKFSFWSSVIEN